MKIDKPENENYSATVIRVKSINKLDNCDNVVGVPLLGFQAIVSKDTKVGDIGIVFTAETQLSEEFTKENNLYRHSERNKNPESSGYIEDNRRVKAMKFRGHRSDALFMPLESLEFTGINLDDLNEGDVFDKLNGHEVCKKYLVRQKSSSRVERNKDKVFKRVEEKFLPMHYDSENYFRNAHVIKGDKTVIVTQKVHGTSVRVGNTLVLRKLNAINRLAKFLGVQVAEKEFDHVYGSRKVIKDVNNPNQNHFYETDIWTEAGKKLDDSVPENFILYGELVGWTPEGAPIQKNYTYRVPAGTNDLYVYRVAIVTNQGMLVDLSWEQVKEFCRDRGLKHVPELWVGKHRYLKIEDYLDKNFFKEGFKSAVPLDDESPCDEGVCVRVDGMAPYILKAKSPRFFEHETAMLDQDIVDLESSQATIDV
jgi:hypothetical protein